MTNDEIFECISYVIAYAPAFPVEDNQDIDKVISNLRSAIEVRLLRLEGAECIQEIKLAIGEIEQAKILFVEGDEGGGCRAMQSAQVRLKNVLSKKRVERRFVISENGEAAIVSKIGHAVTRSLKSNRVSGLQIGSVRLDVPRKLICG